MPPSSEAIIDLSVPFDGAVERISHRKVKLPLTIVEPDPSWPASFALLEACIKTALGDTAVSVEHVGSTSVRGLPAKAVIDIDLTVRDIADEASYVPALEQAGFQFLLREPAWHEHRFFCAYDPVAVNLHVWPPDSPEAARHMIFRNWLRENEADRKAYAAMKRVAAEASTKHGESGDEYTARKDKLVHEILHRAFKDLGHVQ